MPYSLVGEGFDVSFVSWECIAVCYTSVVMCNDHYGLVHVLDGLKYLFMDFSWINDGVCFFGANIKGAFCCKSIVGDSGDGGMLNATIIDRVFFIVGGDV